MHAPAPSGDVAADPARAITDSDEALRALHVLAAKSRILEAIIGGDARVLAAELRAGLEVLVGPAAEVLPIATARRR